MKKSERAMAKAANTKKIETIGKARRAGSPRQPSRGRGLLRYTALVDATEALLQTEDPDEVGLYRIAEQADVPPASVYHFFPTKEAAFTALANRVADRLMEVHRAPIRARDIQSWQALFQIDTGRARDFYNANPAALKIFYGGFVGVDARRVDESVVRRLAGASYRRMDQIFHMPFIRNPEQKFVSRLAILDSIWGVSVKLHGHITEEFHQEALIACTAYSCHILPEAIELRDSFLKLVKSDAMIALPFEDFEQPETADDGTDTQAV